MTKATVCTHMLGSLPCDNAKPHKGNGLGCTHEHGSWVNLIQDNPVRPKDDN